MVNNRLNHLYRKICHIHLSATPNKQNIICEYWNQIKLYILF